jgi:Fe-S-cluster containining protein
MNKADLEARKQQPADVPCGTCRACCKQDVIYLRPDEAARFPAHIEGGRLVLDRKPNGECIHLTERGCAVHDAPPDICRRFDCRVFFLTTPKTQRRIRIQQNPTMRHVYAAGKARLDTLEP